MSDPRCSLESDSQLRWAPGLAVSIFAPGACRCSWTFGQEQNSVGTSAQTLRFQRHWSVELSVELDCYLHRSLEPRRLLGVDHFQWHLFQRQVAVTGSEPLRSLVVS